MGLTLTSADLLQFEAASRALLSSLGAASVEEWRREASRALRELFRADQSMFWLPTERDLLHAENVEDNTLAGYRYFLEEALVLGQRSPDPLVSRFAQRRRTEGIEVYDHGTIDRLLDGRLRESAFHHEVERAGGLHSILAMHTEYPTASGTIDVGLALYYTHPGGPPSGSAALPLLRALLPSYKAGLHALARLGAHRHALDAVGEPVAIFGQDGREAHRNPALGWLLASCGDETLLWAAMRQMAHSLATMENGGAAIAGGLVPDALRTVQTPAGRYRLRGSFLAAGVFGNGPSVVIGVMQDDAPALPPPDALRVRYGLTKREAEVALLLAEGLANDQLAKRLFVSASTARTHTERVLGKLGLSSRKALALKLIQDGSAGASGAGLGERKV